MTADRGGLGRPEIRRVECSHCRGKRNCGVRGSFCESYDDFAKGEICWRILQCLGCDHVFVEVVDAWTLEDDSHVDEETGDPVYPTGENRKIYPALAKRGQPKWLGTLGIRGVAGPNLDKVLLEIYAALGNDLHMLAAMGIRAAFDVAATTLGVNESLDLKSKLKELMAKGLIGAVDESNLEALIEMGNATTHRGWIPKQPELDTMMEILEEFIDRGFVRPAREARLQRMAEKVKTSVPPRVARVKDNIRHGEAPGARVEPPGLSIA